jgi:hypothetical protein
MTRRRLEAFVDALVAGRRPRSFRTDPEDVELMRMAIALRAARPGDANPDSGFVFGLHQNLAAKARSQPVDNTPVVQMRRLRTALAGIAASIVLVGGTVATTEALSQPAVTTAARSGLPGTELRTGTFETTDNQVLGQIVAYHGDPSWVFMNVDVSDLNTKVSCKLQLDNGSTVAVGAIQLRNGMGAWARTLRVNVGRLRGAELVTADGSVLASATFA